jgi:hypothetical protein
VDVVITSTLRPSQKKKYHTKAIYTCTTNKNLYGIFSLQPIEFRLPAHASEEMISRSDQKRFLRAYFLKSTLKPSIAKDAAFY